MGTRSENIVANQIYHICNRSTEGIDIFKDAVDAQRFLDALFCANSKNPRTLSDFTRMSKKLLSELEQSLEPLVEIYAIVLMPNHFHICARSLIDDGISIWLQRACNSHARYFNLKNNRKGSLFMGRYQSILVEDDRQFSHILVYIHANALDLVMPQWRDGTITRWQDAAAFLRNYRWSSYGLYEIGGEIAPEIKRLVSPKFPSEILASFGGLESSIKEWGARNFMESRNIFLE